MGAISRAPVKIAPCFFRFRGRIKLGIHHLRDRFHSTFNLLHYVKGKVMNRSWKVTNVQNKGYATKNCCYQKNPPLPEKPPRLRTPPPDWGEQTKSLKITMRCSNRGSPKRNRAPKRTRHGGGRVRTQWAERKIACRILPCLLDWQGRGICRLCFSRYEKLALNS